MHNYANASMSLACKQNPIYRHGHVHCRFMSMTCHKDTGKNIQNARWPWHGLHHYIAI